MTGEDSVVISKSALDNLLKQLVDAKQAANTLSPTNSHQVTTSAHQGDNDGVMESTNIQQKAVTPINHTESQRPQQKEQFDSKHKDLEYSDVPGLSSSKPMAPQDSSLGEYSSGEQYIKFLLVYFTMTFVLITKILSLLFLVYSPLS